MTPAQIKYRDQNQRHFAIGFKDLPEAEKEELNFIHRIQTTAFKISFYTKRPTQYWKEEGETSHRNTLKDLISEYEEKYGKYELETE